ncbi:MAG: hypothetical protein JO322_00845 [Candidatus Eremiobacteraeota bacterium]|nr:hypothetical protein [Candidatus Eremiobacteraeota bacterium]
MFGLHARRGQTLPIWTFGTLTAIALLGFSVNYGNSIYWQIRAQNAADAAAQGALSIQATHWNALLSDIHAAAVEEYRLRYLLRDLAIITSTNAGANTGCTNSGGTTSCQTIYNNLSTAFTAAANRYTTDVQLIQALDAPTYASDVASVTQAVANFQNNCATQTGGDCAFSYTVVNPQPRTLALHDVISDCCGATVGGALTAPAALNQNLIPLQIEVIACANVKPLFPAALSWSASPTFTAIGRAAATTLMATQEFMEAGGIVNPMSSQPFQPAEFPESNGSGPLFPDNDPNLRVDFGGNINRPWGNPGNPQTSTLGGTFTGGLGSEAMDVYTGWWTTISIPPYSGALTNSQYACNS